MNPSRALIPHGTGTGKTVVAIALADKNCKTCLVVTLKDNVEKWKREISTHGTKTCQYIVLSKEQFKKQWNILEKSDGIIVDECHTFAGISSQLSHALRDYLKKHDTQFRWLLSATPVTATPMSVYVISTHLGHKMNYYSFLRMFFFEMRMGSRRVWRPNPKKEPQLIELVNKLAYGSMIKMGDVVEVPEQKFETEFFELTEDQKSAIKNLSDMEHIVRWTKMHQIENGTLAGNEYEPAQFFICGKNEYIVQTALREKKLAIFARYNHQIEILKGLLEHYNKPIFVINGENKDRDTTVQQIEKATECVVLINTSCGTGYELPSIGTIIFASLSFSYLDYEQSIGRFLRINALKKNRYIHLVTKGGVDEGVYDCIKHKQDFYLELFNNKTKR